jgi:hypothetical protein
MMMLIVLFALAGVLELVSGQLWWMDTAICPIGMDAARYVSPPQKYY